MSTPPDASDSAFPPSELIRPRTRPRADTRTLLGPSYPFSADAPIEPPAAAEHVVYTSERVKQGLVYAQGTLLQHEMRRILSPIGLETLTAYKEACASLLDAREKSETIEHNSENDEACEEIELGYLSIIRTYERSLGFLACLQSANSSSLLEVQDKLIELQKYIWHARYGDVLGAVCRAVKAKLQIMGPGNRSALRMYWTEIDLKLDREKEAYQRFIDGNGSITAFPTISAINQACVALGFEYDVMRSAIHYYADRNKLMHTNIQELIRDGHYYMLAVALHSDLTDIPKVISPAGYDTEILKWIIEFQIQEWFHFLTIDRDNPAAWQATTKLMDYRTKLLVTYSATSQEIVKEITDACVRKANEQVQARRELELVSEIQSVATDSGPRGIKRVASKDLKAETRRMKRQMKAWTGLHNTALGTQGPRTSYIEEFGSLEPPPLIEEDGAA